MVGKRKTYGGSPRGGGSGKRNLDSSGGGRWTSTNDYGFSNQYNKSSNYPVTSPWLANTGPSFNQASDYGASNYNSTSYSNGFSSYQPSYNAGTPSLSAFGQTSSYKASNPDDLLKELGKCYLNNLAGNPVNPGYGGVPSQPALAYQRQPSYGVSRNNMNYGNYQGGYKPRSANMKRQREPQEHNRNSIGSNSYYNNNQKKQKIAVNDKTGPSKPINKTNTPIKRTNNTRQIRKPTSARKPVVKTETNGDVAQKTVAKQKRSSNIEKQRAKIVKQKYNQLERNPFLNENGKIEVGFLRHALYEVFPHDRIHCMLVSSYLLGHRNAVKLIRYELKTLLDTRFGVDNISDEVKKAKREYLLDHKVKVLMELTYVYVDATEEEKATREKVIDDSIDLLTSDLFPRDQVPKEEDYIIDPNVQSTHEDLIKDFQYKFVQYAYEGFGYTLVENPASVENKLKFHINNGFIPGLLVEIVRIRGKPGDKIELPDILARWIERKNWSTNYQNKFYFIARSIYNRQLAKGEQVESQVLDLLPQDEKLGTRIVRDFADAILVFDELATGVKYKLINYTPYINFSEDMKRGIFNEIMKSMYAETLELLKKETTLLKRTYEKLEGVPEEADVKNEVAESTDDADGKADVTEMETS
ncbi:hypothetical protein M8J75_000905 [Diaphorina citri]|nr:hypothetical protein M8J75_000905 [Diaphorina citri]